MRAFGARGEDKRRLTMARRGFGRCSDSPGCVPPAGNATVGLAPGAFNGSNEAAAFSGIDDWLYVAPTERLAKRSSAFTIAVSRSGATSSSLHTRSH